MRKIAIALGLAAAAVAVPAHAGEGRVEARGGVVWDNGDSEATAGVAAGYDWNLGTGAFAGLEVSGDKILTDDTRVSFGAIGRLGANVGGGTKVYVNGGYQSKPCSLCEESWAAGAGVQVPFASRLYGKVEYRHFFVGNGFSDYDAAVAGVGVRF
jgi:hypothetical protein